MPASLPYALAGASIYGLDWILRIAKTRICIAYIDCLPELHTTRLHVPSLNAGWRAGQHVRLRVLSFGVGMFGWTEVHPFTIASACGRTPVQPGLVLMCRNTGRWTDRLYAMASRDGKSYSGGPNVVVMIEGPYGQSFQRL